MVSWRTPCGRVLLEKINGFQLVKKFPAFFGTRRFITEFSSARYLSLFWGSSIQVGVLTLYKILLINICCVFVGLDNKLYKMHAKYIKIRGHIQLWYRRSWSNVHSDRSCCTSQICEQPVRHWNHHSRQ